MRRVLILLFLVSSVASFAQYRWDFGANLGGTNYLGELGGGAGNGKAYSPADLKWRKTRYSFGGFARYKYKQFISFKGNLNYVYISGSDATTTNYGRRGRNLSFTNGLLDAEGIAEIFLLQIRDVGGSYKYKNDIRIYAMLGITGFYSNPKAEYNGAKIALRPLQTEGKAYSPIGIGIPGGFGAYLTIQRIFRVGIEMVYVYTFTDHLDDISNSKYPDPSTLSSPLAAALSNRSGEYTSDPAYLAQYAPGQKRGGAGKDGYMYTVLTGSYVMKGKSAFYKSRYGGLKGKGFKKRRIRAKF